MVFLSFISQHLQLSIMELYRQHPHLSRHIRDESGSKVFTSTGRSLSQNIQCVEGISHKLDTKITVEFSDSCFPFTHTIYGHFMSRFLRLKH